ncbi:MAG: amidohydrolase family protein [Bacteroidota bacterium]
MINFRFFLLTFLLSGTTLLGQDAGLLIRNSSLVNLEKGKIEKRDVLIHEGKIIEVGRKLKANGLMELDAEGLFLMPGLVDAHVHFFQSGGLYTRPDVLDLRDVVPYEQEQAENLARVPDYLERYLKAGITSVIDVGGPMSSYALRDEHHDGWSAPNIFITGPLVSTYQPEAFDLPDAPIVKVASEEEARALVRKQLPFSPDFIKVWYIVLPGQTAQENFEIVQATVEEAHQHRLPVAVHATQLLTAKLALKAGADILVHSVDEPVDQEFVDSLVRKQIPLVPTLTVEQHYIETFLQKKAFSAQDFALANPYTLGSLMDTWHLENSDLDRMHEVASMLEERLEKSNGIRAANLKRLHDAGAIIATGTDAGNIGTQHASSYLDEMLAMQEAGMSNLDVLRASTVNGAKVLGHYPVLGAVQEGSMADVILLSGNPLDSLHSLAKPKYVVKGGALYYTDSLAVPSPADLAQQQLNAYNAGDIDAFLEPYADDVEIYSFPDILLTKGKENMRPNYASMFESIGDLHCELKSRLVQGNTVIDQEFITGLPNNGTAEAIAIYKIEKGKIAKVYFIQ